MAAIFKNGRHLLMHNLISGRQGDYGRWAPGLSSAPCLPSPPQVCSRVYSWLMVYWYLLSAGLVRPSLCSGLNHTQFISMKVHETWLLLYQWPRHIVHRWRSRIRSLHYYTSKPSTCTTTYKNDLSCTCTITSERQLGSPAQQQQQGAGSNHQPFWLQMNCKAQIKMPLLPKI